MFFVLVSEQKNMQYYDTQCQNMKLQLIIGTCRYCLPNQLNCIRSYKNQFKLNLKVICKILC